MVTEEIDLNDFLIAQGYDVLETDLGEYIIQLKHEPPSHIVVPAMHLSKESVAETFYQQHQHLDPERPLDTPRQMLDEVRALMRQHFQKADVGITGANFIIADTGQGVIVSNEGNADLCQINAKTHIVVTGIEKVAPTVEAVNPVLRLLARSATGQDTTTYVTISSGPASKQTALDGPENYHVVLVDNGRSDMLKTEMRAMLRCIRCGACINHCPVYHAVGGQSYGSMYMGPMGAVLTPSLFGPNAAPDLPNASTFCGRCEQVCPMKIPLPDLMRDYRAIQFKQKYTSWAARTSIKAWAWLAKKPKLYASITSFMASSLKTLNKITGNKGYFKHLLGAGGWTKFRNFPAPEGETFQSQYRKQKNYER
jgi:L-lactate dehydrogenase complex protein LldF